MAFDAGTNSFPSTAIGKVKLDGTGFHDLVSKDDDPPGFGPSAEAHAPAYAPDGSVCFEAEWGGSEQIWRQPAGGGRPSLVQSAFTDDNSPTVLPDGRVASLWLGSATGSGRHEIKVMDADGQPAMTLTSTNSPFSEVDDVGLGAGPLWAPTLTIRQAGGAVEVSWAERFTNFTLQTASGPPGSSWRSLPATAPSVTVPATNAAQLFRLVRLP